MNIAQKAVVDTIEAKLREAESEYEPLLPGGTPVASIMKAGGTKEEVEAKLLKDSDKGLRASAGKIRFDLLEPFAMEQLAKIFTKGAAKYADNNWLKGMKWSKMVASLERHLAAFKEGKDYDFDPNCEGCKSGTCLMHTGEMHIAQAAWNALGLTSYYKYYPQGDDRLHNVLDKPKVGLDIDGVICDWFGPWSKKFGYTEQHNWNFSYDNKKHFFDDMTQEELIDFYSSLPPLIDAKDLPFEPHCYITARTIPKEITMAWIQANGFPTKPVYSVGFGNSKVEVAKESGITHIIDDSYDNFTELNKEGIACFLLDALYNQKYDVGYRRVKSIKEFADKYMW